MYNGYFVVTLKSGERIDFNKECSHLNEFGAGKFINFQKEFGNGYLTLAIINSDEISIIRQYDKNKED